MNRYEQRADQQRRAGLRTSMTIWTAALALIAVVLAILILSGSAPAGFSTKAAIVLAVVFLILRQLSRRLKGKTPRAAQPDPRSTLKLH